TRGVTAPAELIFDGGKYGAVRLTVTHSKAKPTGRGTTALWVRVEEGGGLAALRKAMVQGIGATIDGTRIDIAVPGQKGDLRLVADVAAGARIAAEGAEPGTGEALLAVDGRDYGRELLGKVDVIARYQNALDAAMKGQAGSAKAEAIVQAEDAQVILLPFRIDEEAGEKFVWMPGEAGSGGGSGTARALWLVHVPKAGDYRLWGRVQAPTPSDDSFFVRVRQGEKDALPQTAWHAGQHKTWAWAPVSGEGRQPVAIPLQPGVALVEFRCREDGARLDAFTLTSRKDWKP
ncbi:hypothetical protein HQ560_09870, partial [bacterium]|nr:hypothetical protein [bacterium]